MSSKLDEHKATVLAMKQEGKSNSEIARWFSVNEKSVRRALKRWHKGDDVNFHQFGNTIEITTRSTRLVTEPDELMRELGVDPSEWDIYDIKVNRWGDANDPSYQLKASLRPLRPKNLVLPASDVSYSHGGVFSDPEPGEARLGVFASDFHAPFHDPQLFRLFCNWLAYNQPHEIVVGGDLCDFPEISRHRHKPEWKASTQECIDTAYLLLLDMRTSSEKSKMFFLPGNHDERIRNAIIDNNKDFFSLRPADQGDGDVSLPVWDLRNLLHLDALAITYIDPAGTYEYAVHPVSDKLGATHGWVARNKSALSAAGTLEALGHSVIIGHTHRRGFYYETRYELDGTPRDLVAVEAGCMCLHKKGLGYARAANWQQGFVTYAVQQDGTFNIEPAVYVNGKLYWRDQVFA